MMNKVIVNPYSLRTLAAKATRHLIEIPDRNRGTAPAGEFHIGNLNADLGIYQDAILELVVAINSVEIRPVEANALDPHIVTHNLEEMFRARVGEEARPDRKSTRLNSSHLGSSYAVFFL